MIPLQNSDANSKKISDSKQINEEVTKNEGQDNSFEIIPSCDNFASWQSPHQTASPQRLVMICDGNGCISGLESTSPPRHARRQVIIIEDDDPEQQKKSQQANLPEIKQNNLQGTETTINKLTILKIKTREIHQFLFHIITTIM